MVAGLRPGEKRRDGHGGTRDAATFFEEVEDMGIDFHREGFLSREHVSWSYGGFSEFRRRIARAIGLNLDEMCGFYGNTPWPEHPLVPFLHHSDCDGELSAKECVTIRHRRLLAFHRQGWHPTQLNRVRAHG